MNVNTGTKTAFDRWVRLVVALVLGVPVAVGAVQALPVAATGATFVPRTAFAIDGNPAGPNDFDAGYGPGVTPDGLATTGLYYNHRSVDQGGVSGCSLAADDTALGGTKIADGPVWPSGGPNPNGKTDINWVDIAAEKVDVNGQINDVLYVGYEKCGGNGTWQAMLYLDDGDGLPPTGGDLNGDYLFVFDFNPSSGAVTIYLYRLAGGAWTLQPTVPVSAIDGFAALDYGEVALNLTTLGIVSESTCRGVNVSGQAAAITGGDLSSAVKDLVQVQPLLISNCGALAVSKVSSPAGVSSAASFHYVVDQSPQINAADLDVVHDGSLAVDLGGSGSSTEPDANFAELDANILIGGVHNWSNVISQSDYRIVEDAIPSGWTLNRIVCSYTDIFVSPPAVTSVVIYQNGGYTGNDFLIPPASLGNVALAPASCVITNATSGVIVKKAGTGNPDTAFGFTVVKTPATSIGTPQLKLGEQSTLFSVTPGSSVTVTETNPGGTPGWTLDSIACVANTSGLVTPTSTTATSQTFTTLPGQVITCTFTNNQKGRIIVAKTGAPTGGSFGFDHDVIDLDLDGAADASIPIGGSFNTGDITPGTYHINELLVAANAVADPDFVGSASCSVTTPGSGTSSMSVTGVNATVTLGAGDIVTCTFSNVQNGRLVVKKSTINGDSTFNFTGAVAGAITTSGGVGTTSLTSDVLPGTYAEAETAKPGYTLTSSTCNDGSAVGSIGVAAGEIVTCTFVNTRNQANFTLNKVWVDAVAGNSVDLDADGSDVNAQIIDTSSTAPTGAGGTMVVYSGETVRFSEAFSAGSAANYITTLVCTDASGGLVNTSGQLTGQLVIKDSPSAITCTFTNTRKTSSLVLQKAWVNGNGGDTAQLTADGINDASATSTATGAAGSQLDGTNKATIATVFVGESINLTELVSAPANYNASLACVGGALTYTGGASTGSVVVTPADQGGQIVCTFTNTRKRANLVLTKSWADSPANGDTVGLTIGGGDATPVAGSNSNDATANDSNATSVVYAGETLNLAEGFGAGLASNYVTTLDCGAHAVTYTGGALTGSIAIGAVDANATITCAFVNTRQRTTLTLRKNWVNPYAGDTAGLAIDATNDDTDTAVAPAASGTSAATAGITVFAGETVNLTETFGSGNSGTYNVTAFSCSAGTPGPVWATGAATLAVAVSAADTGAPIICTVQNTRRSATFTLAKSWTDPVGGSALTLHAAGNDPNLAGNILKALTSPTNGSASMTVYSGETVSFDETFAALGDVARFTTTLECGGLPTTLTQNGAALAATFAVGAAPVDTTCTFTNVRRSTNLELHKNWVRAAAGDSFGLAIDATNDAGPVPALAAGGSGASAAFATVVVYAGESAALTEAAGTNVGSYLTTALSCSAGQTSWVSGASTGRVVVDAADIGMSPIVCTFTNTRRAALLTLNKVWDDRAGGAVVALAAHGSDPDVGGSIDASSTSPTAFGQSMAVYSGESIDVSEQFTTGDPANYSSSLSCSDGTVGVYAGTVQIPATPVAISCTFTNVRKSTTLTLEKGWAGAVLGDQADLSIVATESDGPVTAIAPDGDGVSAQTASITVYAGETVALSEVIDPNGTNIALYDATDFRCTAGTPNPVWVSGATSLSTRISAADTAAPISCSVENTARRGDILIVKSIDGNGGDFGFRGSWINPSGFTLSPPTDGAAQRLFQGVLVPKSGINYSVAEQDPGALYGTTVQCADGAKGGASSSPAAPTAGLQGSIGLDNRELVTCTFNNTQNGIVTIVKQADPELAQEFAFNGELGAFRLDDDGVGDNFVVFSNVIPGTYNVTELATLGWDLTNLVCIDAAGGTASTVDLGTATATIKVDPAEAVSCTFTNTARLGEVSVTKSVTGVDPGLAWSFDFTIAPFAGTVAPSATQVASGTGNTTSPARTWTGLVPGQTYAITETVPAGWTAGSIACTVTHADRTTTSLIVASFTVAPGDTISCDFDNAANPSQVEITKTVDGGLLDDVAWSFDFTISPVPSGEISLKPAAGSGSSSATVGWGGLTPGTTYTIGEVVPNAGFSAGVLTCTAVNDVDLADQTVTFVAPLGGAGVDITCTVTNTATSNVRYAKVVDGAPVRNATSGVWTVDYLLTVSNAADAGTGVYDLDDTFNFGHGVTIVADSASVTNTAPGTIVTNPGFDGVTDTSVVTGRVIAAGTTHTYRVTVDVTIAVGRGTDGDCKSVDGAGTGFLNAMTIRVDAGQQVTKDACAGFATLTLVKQLVNDDGGNATLADFPLTAVGPATISGVSPVSSAMPAGQYRLSEPVVAGYTSSAGFVCTGGELVDGAVALTDGLNAVCTIINDDQPVDLELTKDDGGVSAVAGGAPYSYTITVRNIGTRDADLGEPVTVTDTLPAGLDWVSIPANCVQAGQTVSCDIDPALLPAGGTAVVITVTVRALAGAPSGIYENKASVTTDDDPVCVGECVPPPCPATGNNNVDCEQTPVARVGAIQIVKTDDVADGVSVRPGDTYSYGLVVTDTGPATILPGLVVDDALPAELELVSVSGGSGWTCNAVDPVACTYAPALAPGSSAPAITVTVRVALEASGTSIVNVAVTTGAIDRDCSGAVVRLVESHFVAACNQVTDSDDETTPLNPVADLAIVKTASVAQVGAGGGFNWVLDVTNNGPGVAVNVKVGDIVPSQVTVTGVSSSQFTCSRVGNAVSCTKPSMAVGETGKVTIAVVVPSAAVGGVVVNVGTVTADTPDPNLANNSDDASVDVVAQQVPTTTLPPVVLPPTGSNSTGPLLQAALMLLLMGGGIVLITRRRRTDTNI